MLIIKEKCPIFVGINKDQSPKILDSIPSKGACFEFESFSNQDVLEFSLIQQKLHENPNDLEAQKSIIRFAENSIKNIHNTTLKKTQFPILFQLLAFR